MKTIGTIFLLLFCLNNVQAQGGFTVVESPFSVKVTMDKIETVIKNRKMTVFARINHAEGAEKMKMQLRPTEVILFGNPKIGTLLMQSNQEAGIDLPMKILVYQSEKKVLIKYYDGTYLAKKHKIKDKKETITKINNALNGIVNTALKK